MPRRGQRVAQRPHGPASGGAVSLLLSLSPLHPWRSPMSTSRTASRPWPAMWAAAALVLAIAAGRATAAELLAVSDSEPATADAAPATPWRIFAVSSDRSTFTPGLNALGVRLAAGDRASCTRNLGLDDAKGL